MEHVASNAPAEMPLRCVTALQTEIDRVWDFVRTMGSDQTCAYIKSHGQLDLNNTSKLVLQDFPARLFGRMSGAVIPQLPDATPKCCHLQLILAIGLSLQNFIELWGKQCSGESAAEAVTLFTALLKSFQEAISYLPLVDADTNFVQLSEKAEYILSGYRKWVEAAANDERFVPALQYWVKSAPIKKEDSQEKESEWELPGDRARVFPQGIPVQTAAINKSPVPPRCLEPEFSFPTTTSKRDKILVADISTMRRITTKQRLQQRLAAVSEKCSESEGSFISAVSQLLEEEPAAPATCGSEAVRFLALEDDEDGSSVGVRSIANEVASVNVGNSAPGEMAEVEDECGSEVDSSSSSPSAMVAMVDAEGGESVGSADDLSEIARSDGDVYDMVVPMPMPSYLPLEVALARRRESAEVALISWEDEISWEDQIEEEAEVMLMIIAAEENGVTASNGFNNDGQFSKEHSESLLIRGVRAIGGVVARVAAAVKTVWGMVSRLVCGGC